MDSHPRLKRRLSLIGQGEARIGLPEADPAGVYVDEPGARVITNAAGALRQSGPAKVLEAASRQRDINRLALDMKAVDGDALAVRMEHRVGGGRAVSGNHLERLVGAESMLDSCQQIEQRRVDGFYFVGAEIAQEVVDAIKLARKVVSILPVSGAQGFAGVQIVEFERAMPQPDRGACECDGGYDELRGGNRANAEEAPPR